MSSQTSMKQKTLAVTPCQTMRGHTSEVRGIVHLLQGQRIVTSSWDSSLRLWDLESGTQIGEDWRDTEEKKAWVYKIALSPNGKTVVSGSEDGKVRLWDVETGKVVTKWAGHNGDVYSVCWSADGKRVGSGSWDGTARVWDVKSGETILEIETGHTLVYVVIYSPDDTKIATGGHHEHIKIWDAKTGKLLATLEHKYSVSSLAWTSDGKKLISASDGPIRIFNTTTWQQIAILEGHTDWVRISLSQNDHLLASASRDETIRLWNLDTNLPVCPPFQHEDGVECAALSTDGKALVTGSDKNNVYMWDIHATLKKAGFEDLLSIPRVPARKSLKDSGATRPPPIQTRRIPPRFFDESDICSSTSRDVQPLSSHRILAPSTGGLRALLARIPSLFRRPHPHNSDATELQQIPRQGIFSLRGPRTVDVAAVQDRKPLFVAPRPKETQQQGSQSHGQGSSSQSRPTATSTSTTQLAPNSGIQATTPRAATVRSRILTLLACLVLLICCAPLPSTDGH